MAVWGWLPHCRVKTLDLVCILCSFFSAPCVGTGMRQIGHLPRKWGHYCTINDYDIRIEINVSNGSVEVSFIVVLPMYHCLIVFACFFIVAVAYIIT